MCRSHCRLALTLAFGLTGVLHAQESASPPPAAARPTTQAAEDPKADAEAARKEREEQLRTLPVVNVKGLRDVVTFALEKDAIVLRTNVPPTEMAAIVVDGKPTYISVWTQADAGNGAAGAAPAPATQPYQPIVFQLVRHEFTPSGGVGITHISAVAPRISISRSSEAPGEPLRNVDFIQDDPAFLEDGGDRVRFYVQEIDGDQTVVDLKLSAANIAELRRKYPAETMRFLEPIFREFGQSGVLFQVNDKAAWQVLGGSFTPSPDVVKQVDAVLARLDADDAKVREAASKELEQLGQPAALVLMRRDRAKLTEEQLSRVETFLAAYKPLSDDEAARMRDDPEFLLMALSSNEPELASRALERLKAVAKEPLTFDPNATGAKRFEAIAKLREQLLPATTQPATKQILRGSASDPPPQRAADPAP